MKSDNTMAPFFIPPITAFNKNAARPGGMEAPAVSTFYVKWRHWQSGDGGRRQLADKNADTSAKHSARSFEMRCGYSAERVLFSKDIVIPFPEFDDTSFGGLHLRNPRSESFRYSMPGADIAGTDGIVPFPGGTLLMAHNHEVKTDGTSGIRKEACETIPENEVSNLPHGTREGKLQDLGMYSGKPSFHNNESYEQGT